MPEEKDIAEASDAGSQVLIEDAVREPAHQLFEQRSFEHGHDLDDWLQAEGEIASKKRPDPADKPITENELVLSHFAICHPEESAAADDDPLTTDH